MFISFPQYSIQWIIQAFNWYRTKPISIELIIIINELNLKHSVIRIIINGHTKKNRQVQVRLKALFGRGIVRKSILRVWRVGQKSSHQENITTHDCHRRLPQGVPQHRNCHHEKTQTSQHCRTHWYRHHCQLHLPGPRVLQRRRPQKVLHEQALYRRSSFRNTQPIDRRILSHRQVRHHPSGSQTRERTGSWWSLQDLRFRIRQIFWRTQSNGQNLCRNPHLHVASSTQTKAIHVQIRHLVIGSHVLWTSVRKNTLFRQVRRWNFQDNHPGETHNSQMYLAIILIYQKHFGHRRRGKVGLEDSIRAFRHQASQRLKTHILSKLCKLYQKWPLTNFREKSYYPKS